MFKPPFGLYCPLFRSSSYPAPMTPESRTDFSSNQSKNPFFWPGCVACVARSRHPSVARSSLAPPLFPRPTSRSTVRDPAPDPLPRARSIDRRFAVLSPIASSRARVAAIDRSRGAPIARVARARRSRVARAAPRPSRPRSRARSRRLQDKTTRARCAPCPRRPSSPRRASSRTCSRRSRRRAWS